METDYIPAIRQAIEYHKMIVERKVVIKKLKTKNIELNKRNFEIQSLLQQIEKSNMQKMEIITHLTKEIIPFVSEVVKTTGNITEGTGARSIFDFRSDVKYINETGIRISELLLKVEKLLMLEIGNTGS